MIGLVFWVALAFVAYTYAGYPLLVTLVGRLRPEPIYGDHTPKVTLIVAAFNEAAVIGDQLRRIAALDYPADLLQVIVAADGSDDATADIARSFPGIEVVHRLERAGKMAAIQRAMEWATGDVIVTTDTNNRLRTDALRLLVAPFADPSVGAVTGRKVVGGEGGLGFGEGMYWRYEAHIRRMETRIGCTVGVNGELFAIRREAFAVAPAGTINDDQWLAHHAMVGGWNVVFRPEAVSEETVSASAADEAERRSRMVAGQFQVFSGLHRQLPWRRPVVAWMLLSHKVFRPLVPLGMLAALAASIAAVVVSPAGNALHLAAPWNQITLAAQAAFYAAAALGERLPRLGGIGYLPRFLVMQNLATLRGMWRHLRHTQSAAWLRADRRRA
ncbi:MAG: glycosyltransferase family 2 protein [Acidimicrobiia bacterium]|nr:glycosyltransferase family 2 protein [Acidimicrobiia bacterium]